MCTPAIAVVGSLLGSVVQAAGIQAQASAQADAEERRARFAERQKDISRTQASHDRKRTRQDLARILGNNRAAGAERGLSRAGSLTDVMDDTTYQAAGELEANRFKAEAERGDLTHEAQEARARARAARRSGGIRTFGALLGGGTRAATTLGRSSYRRF